jgi:branched-chain amino acid transport system substrate-binding protein
MMIRYCRFLLALILLVPIARPGIGLTAENLIKVGLIVPMTGYAQSTGKEIDAAVRLFVKQNGDTVAGRKIQVILRDDGAVPQNTKRIAQELVVDDHVAILGGFGVTPSALAVAPLATQAKIVQVVMAAGGSRIAGSSPYIVLTSGILSQSAWVIADWAAKNSMKTVDTIVSDYAPGLDAEMEFTHHFGELGGTISANLRVAIESPDFAPVLQHVINDKPDAVFIFVPTSAAESFIRQFVEKGLDKANIKILGTGDIAGDDQLPHMSNAIIGAITAHYYSAWHQSAINKEYTKAFSQILPDVRPNFMSVGGYDGMRLIYNALEKTGGDGGDGLIAAMKNMSFESPRGPISIGPNTREIEQNIYVRRVESIDGQLYNREFETYEHVRLPSPN